MFKQAVLSAAFAFVIPIISDAQVSVANNPDEILRAVNQHVQRGEACLSAGDRECARREFDTAVDEFLESGLDLRSDQHLLAAWREMIEKINGYETAPVALTGKQFWKSQEFEGRPPEELAARSNAVQEGPLGADAFQMRFADLRKLFQEKYHREITLTGADHAEHRRLYGSGSAYDIRVRDLTREQVSFIVTTGRGLGLRIKDFSTWETVAAHNARVRVLGRSLDTLATGVHLHIDRMTLPRKKDVVAVPAATSRPRESKRAYKR